MLLNPPSPLLNLKVNLVSYVIGCENYQKESGVPHLCSRLRFSWSAESGSKHYDWDPHYCTFVILFPSFAARFPSASCTLHFHCT